jgi:hypothetical protein
VSTVAGLYEPGSFHVDPTAMTEWVRQYPNANPGVLASSFVVKPTSGLLFGFTACSTNAGSQFIQFHNAAALPANGAVPLFFFPVASSNVVAFGWTPPRAFRNGIVICNSSTAGTLTIGAADCLFDVQYV